MKRRAFLIVFLALLLLGMVFRNPIGAYGKSALLITEVFPGIGVRPLDLIAADPLQSRTTFPSARGTVVADIFMPQSRFGSIAPRSAPAVIVALGVRSLEKDRPLVFNLGRALARLGFVALWPRLEPLDRELPLTEEPTTFVEAFRYLEGIEAVDPKRISLVGFSVGASIAFVGASDEAIADRVRALVFFGGYFDVFDYLTDIATRSAVCGNQTVDWPVDSWVSEHMQEILQQKGSTAIARVFQATSRQEAEAILRAAPRDQIEDLARIDPRGRADRFRAHIFILHDGADAAVSSCSSARLRDALPPGVAATYLLVHVFEHVAPTGGISPETLDDFGRLLSFLAAVIDYM